MYGLTFIHNVNFHIRFFVFVILVLDVVALPLVALEGVHWLRDGAKYVYKVHGCNVTNIAKYNLIQHLQMWYNVIMELSKFEHPSTWEEGLKRQDHTTMNVQVLNNLLVQFCCNEHKAIAKAKRLANLEWNLVPSYFRSHI